MKDSRSTNNKQSKQGMSHKPMPEIRDNLDSRSNEEQLAKGKGDFTTNKKETKSEKHKKKDH